MQNHRNADRGPLCDRCEHDWSAIVDGAHLCTACHDASDSIARMDDATLRAVIAARLAKCDDSNRRVLDAINAGRSVRVAQAVRELDESILFVLYAEAARRGW